MSTPTDTPETTQHSMSCEYPEGCSCGASKFNSLVLKLRALEDKVKELEAANAELIQRLQDRVESYLAASRRDVQTIQQQSVELDKLRASLRLRPIAEAGPVPEEAVRVYARFFKELSEWVFSASLNDAIHFIDIYPAAEAQEGQEGGQA